MPPELAGGRDRWLAAIPALHKMMGSGALTLIHGDLRMDNLMFGAAPGQAPAVAVDWCVCFSLPTQDLAYLFSQNMRIEDRRRHERRLIALYHRKLVEAGVTGYSPDQAWRDYETAVLYLYQYAVTIGGALDPGNARGLLLMQRLVERASTAIMDLGLLDRLPG
jgi:thiamine kinase-like enzyme